MPRHIFLHCLVCRIDPLARVFDLHAECVLLAQLREHFRLQLVELLHNSHPRDLYGAPHLAHVVTGAFDPSLNWFYVHIQSPCVIFMSRFLEINARVERPIRLVEHVYPLYEVRVLVSEAFDLWVKTGQFSEPVRVGLVQIVQLLQLFWQSIHYGICLVRSGESPCHQHWDHFPYLWLDFQPYIKLLGRVAHMAPLHQLSYLPIGMVLPPRISYPLCDRPHIDLARVDLDALLLPSDHLCHLGGLDHCVLL